MTIPKLRGTAAARWAAQARSNASSGPNRHARAPENSERIARRAADRDRACAATARGPPHAHPDRAFAKPGHPEQCESLKKPWSGLTRGLAACIGGAGESGESF